MTERDIFLAALEIDDLDARQAHIVSACAGDSELLSRVEALLASHESQSQFLETPAVEQMAGESTAPQTESHGEAPTRDEVAATMIQDSPSMSKDSNFSFLSSSERLGFLGRLGHYEIEEVLGKGAFGIVFKAFDEKLHRVVAIKVLAPEMAATSPARKRFLREARSSAAVRHENVVAIYAVEEEPIPYLVMEYIPSKTLLDRLNENGPLDVSEVLRTGKQIADGLAAAHSQGLIHRDIKPGNILLDTSISNHVKITDFGLARAADDASVTQSGVIAGTPMYMAPEQAMGHKLDTRADLFSLGSVLYQMVSGRPPFRAPSTVAVLKRVVDEEPRPIREIIPETPEWLCDIIGRLHVKDPDKRYQTASEVSADLDRSLRQYQQDGVVTGVVKPAWEAETVVTKVEKPKPGGGWFNTLLWLGAVCLFLVALIFVAASNLFNPPSVNNAVTNSTTDVAPNPPSSPALPGWQGWPIDAPPPAIAPFTAEEAKMYQVAWATYLGVPVEYTNSIGMKFRLIPPGEFMMGSTPEEIEAALEVAGEDMVWLKGIQSEAPQHKVKLTQPVYVAVTEVTQAQYEQVIGTNPSHFSATGEGKDAVTNLETDNHPVEMVSWNDAVEFCAKLSQQEQLKPFYFRSGETITPLKGTGYRLPTEAEWESACRAGTTTRFWSGEEDKSLMQVGWFMRNSGKRTHATGELKANPFGLFDVHGNVWEWVQDNWDPAYYGKFEENAAVDPCSPFLADSQQVIRGGYWFNYPSHCRSSCRLADPPTYRNYVIGFRIALPVDAVKQSLQRNLIESSPVELFNGQELTGWKMHPDAPGNWHVENGELISDGKPSYLFSERNDYDNFELTCEVSISDGGDSGLIVRSPFEKVGPNGLPGYEAQIQAGKVLTAGWATGAIAQSGTSTGWSLKQYSSISVPPNEYFTLKVRAAHNRVKTYVNGVQVAEYVDPAWTYQRGHIALQHSGANTVIKFRKITVTELVPEQSTTTPANFALQFDGIDDFVSIPVQLGMVGRYVPDRPFTYEAFFTPHQQRPEVEQGVLKKEALPPPLVPGVLGFFRIGALTYQPGKHLLDWVESTQIFSDAPIVKNQEHHVAMVWDGQVMQMYVDGVKQNLGRAVIPPLDSAVQSEFDNAPFSLCGMQTQNGFVNTFAGTIREVRISTTARYTDDFIPEQRLTTDASTIGLYHCDDGAGNTLADASGNNRHGTIHGANWVRTDRVPAVRPTSEFALQFDGVDDCVEWSELSVPLDRPVRIELAATVDSIQTNAETGIPIFNWGGAVAVSAAADPNIGDVLTVRFLSNPGVHHTWHIRNAVEAGRRFSLVVDYRDGVANFSVNGRPVPASQLRYVLQRDGESDFDARPETFRLFSDMKRSFLATPSTHPDQKSIALHGKVHHLKLTQDTGDTIAEFDFTQGSGDVLNDSSGNGHDGKIVGATWVKADDSAIVAQEQFDWSTIWPADAPAPAIAPFTTDEAKAHQEAWAKYLGVPVEYENSIGMKFRLIPPGEFMMGSTPEEIAAAGAGEPALGKQLIEAEGPQHRVVLTQPFYLAATELTQAEFEEILGRNPSQFSPNGARKAAVDGMETAKFPVDRLSWHEAAEFCIALSEREKMKPSYFRNGAVVTSLGNDGYHMPTEAEWEFACRAGTTSLYSSGDSVGDAQRVAWLRPNSGARTHAVGELPPNAFGLFDVHGNVWEWTEDGYDPLSYSKGTERPFVAPRVELGPEHLRVIRGGNFNCADPLARSAHRRGSVGHWSGDGLGVRISLPFAAVKAAIERPDTPETPISEYQWPTDAPAPAIAPFTADEAKAHQEAWAKYLGVPVEYENSIGMKFRLIPPGEFMMGSTLEEIAAALSVVGEDKTWQEEVNSEGPQHRVVLTQPIYVGVTEVTQSQYENVVGTTPSHFSATGDGREAVANLDTNDHPVERVTWNDAAEFCANLSQQSRLKPFYFRSGPSVTLLAGNGYRLPTEAEWEFSCRAGTMTRFWCGTDDSDLLAAAWFRANAGSRTHPVGELKLNPFGLADVYGNVWEWTQDSWSTKSYNQLDATSLIDPLNLTDTSPQHVIRGGYFWDVPSYCRSSNRRTTPPGAQYNNQGFRVVLPVDAVRQLSSEEANR